MWVKEELLECPICWEPFNLVENVPYIFWCGHSLCKTCVLSLQWAQLKFPTLPIQLPFFVSCPWCQLVSFRLIWKGNVCFPRKNFLLLWLVESTNGDRISCQCSPASNDSKSVQPSSSTSIHENRLLDPSTEHHQELPRGSPSIRQGRRSHLLGGWRVCTSLHKSFSLMVRLTAKFPLVVVFMLVVLYVIPTSAAILVAYLLLTFLFALPAFLILYFSYPILDWLVSEIIA